MGLFSDIGGAIGGLVGYAQGSGDRKRQRQMYEQALREMQGLPTDSTDTLLGAYQTGPSAYDNLYANPDLVSKQSGLLDDLIAQSRQNGLGVQEQVALRQAQNAVNANEASQRAAILQQMAMRGMAGSGSEMAAQLAAQQGGANRMAAMGGQAASDAANRQMAARVQAFQGASNMRGQDFGERSTRAQALDALQRFNASQRSNAYGDAFNQRMGKQAALTGIYTGTGNMYDAQQRNRTNAYAGIGTGLGAGGDAAAAAWGGGTPAAGNAGLPMTGRTMTSAEWD